MGERRSRVLNRAVRRDESEDAVVALRPERRRTDVELARLFHDMNTHHHYVYKSCANIGEFGEKKGFSAREARTLAAAGEALELNPEIEERILDGRISLDAAAALGKIYQDPSLIRDGEDWLQKAEVLAASQLQREIRKRMLEVEEEEPTSRMDVLMTSRDREVFERARQVVCEKERKILDEGRTIGWLSDFFLDREDPDRVKEGTRRVGDTAHIHHRYIPASVKRMVRRRAGKVCQYPGCCNRIFLNYAHRKWHSHGGSREAGNLLLLCQLHHAMLDAGWIRVKGPSDDPRFFERVRNADGSNTWREVKGVRDPPA